MKQTNNGGAAFPLKEPLTSDSEGMTLRDYFAAKAMQGICAHVDTWGMGGEAIVTTAYEMADVMLAARGAA